ncbi:hypothetical protein D3C86_957860 [compost metagenome]
MTQGSMARGAVAMRIVRASTPGFSSPATATWVSRSLPSSEASMSKWTTRAWGANSASLPVARSSKRAPRTISRSDDWTASLAARVPCMPSIPR